MSHRKWQNSAFNQAMTSDGPKLRRKIDFLVGYTDGDGVRARIELWPDRCRKQRLKASHDLRGHDAGSAC
ncbi:MAG: hypothetical protein CEE38_05040 [Planctomycetes bacterium B3_Pla]|nr:MAG: hypothetical protein CEE38_05040 [Planctomycetes bacterium B3_Pla]